MLKLNLTQQLSNFELNINLTLPAKGVTAIFGRSGAGKSSLINLIAGLSTAQSGLIELNGRTLFDSQKGINLPPEKRHIGYVFQEHRLFLIIRWRKTSNTVASGQILPIFYKLWSF